MNFIIEFSDEAKKDIAFFQKAGDKASLKKIKKLIVFPRLLELHRETDTK
jgi:hypothetical protein